MEFEQKAEEKKMSMSKNIARLAVTAGLTAALSFGGVMAPVTMAFAAGSGAGSITISRVEGNENTTFKAYQIFKATVTDTNGVKTAQDITWASSSVGQKVITAITSDWKAYNSLSDSEKLPAKPTPQEVADFITAHAGDCTAGSESTKGTRIATNNILYAVANAIRDEEPVKSDIVAGTAWTPETSNGSGYYLFVTNALSDLSKKDTGTSPIFALVGGEAVTVTEKTSIPTVDKQILAATSDNPTKLEGWAGVADSQIGQEVTYKLTGKVADNYATYDSYAYKFTDTLSNGLDYVKDSLKVYAVDSSGNYTPINDTAYELTTSKDNRVLTVNFAVDKATGKKGLKDIDFVDADTEIVVFYNAKLNKNAVTGNGTEGKGNYNAVKLEYSNNPYTEGTGTSVEGGAGDFTFKLNLNKVDQGTEKGLPGAVFTIQSDDANTQDQYVASKAGAVGSVSFVAGQLVTVPSDTELPDYVKFTSGNDGKIAVSGLDAGTYKVHEVSAPNGGYNNTIADFTFTITPTYTTDGTLKVDKLVATLNSSARSDVVMGELDDTAGDNVLNAKSGTETKPADGEITITVGNTKSIGLPLTGLNGVTFTWIAGGAVLCIGVAHLIRSRKQAEESEQE